MKNRLLLVLLILSMILFVWGDQLLFHTQNIFFEEKCGTAISPVVLWKKLNDGRYVSVNGIYLGYGVILTVDHAVDNGFSIKTSEGISQAKIKEKIAHSGLDLSLVVLDQPLNLPSIKIGGWRDSFGPYSLVTLRRGKISLVFAGSNFRTSSDGMLVFDNKVAQPGDSGGALLDSKCRLVGMVTGGDHKYFMDLKPHSFYINLQNHETVEWIRNNVKVK